LTASAGFDLVGVVQFSAAADSYDRFMGRYTTTLAPALADAAGVTGTMRVLDVGCGPGGLTRELAGRVGGENVAAIDPAAQFAAACRERNPGVDARQGVAEQLPWPDASFDAALACLVIAFMQNPDQGVREMARVTRPGGSVAACMWDTTGGGMTMLRILWDAARKLDPDVGGERGRPGVSEGDIAQRFAKAGLDDVVDGTLEAHAEYADFDDFWEPFTLGVGPAGEYVARLSDDRRGMLRELCREAVPSGPFSLTARAWYARGTPPA
jgi:ubiquinone/menaquinone biosynthesis C-methylase UbiE